MSNASEGTPHSCLAQIAEIVLPRSDLTDQPLANSDIIMFVDGSSSKFPDGSDATGFAVVTFDKVLKSGKLPSHLSAQAAELIALTEACKLGANKSVTIYTDSQYAFSTIHVFAQQWKNRATKPTMPPGVLALPGNYTCFSRSSGQKNVTTLPWCAYTTDITTDACGYRSEWFTTQNITRADLWWLCGDKKLRAVLPQS
ncbi:hypothetical protein MHYP_G00173540 [Metynnis hypsauchen]